MTDADYGELRIERMLSGRLSNDIHDFLVSIAGDIRIEGIAWGGAAIQYLDTTSYLKQIKTPTVIVTAVDDIVVKPDARDALIAIGLGQLRDDEVLSGLNQVVNGRISFGGDSEIRTSRVECGDIGSPRGSNRSHIFLC